MVKVKIGEGIAVWGKYATLKPDLKSLAMDERVHVKCVYFMCTYVETYTCMCVCVCMYMCLRDRKLLGKEITFSSNTYIFLFMPLFPCTLCPYRISEIIALHNFLSFTLVSNYNLLCFVVFVLASIY